MKDNKAKAVYLILLLSVLITYFLLWTVLIKANISYNCSIDTKPHKGLLYSTVFVGL